MILFAALLACAGTPEDTGLSNGWQPGEPFHGYVWGVPEGETLTFIGDLSADARPGEGPDFCFELADDGDFYAIWPDISASVFGLGGDEVGDRLQSSLFPGSIGVWSLVYEQIEERLQSGL